jgi:alcohol dehydrogenase, propanol-preferring
MKAAVLYKNERYLKIEEVTNKSISPGMVRIKIKCCGVCGSDLHMTLHAKLSLPHYPVILGHESSGVVNEIGEGVTKFKKGDRVVISSGISCGTCQHCLEGKLNLCTKKGVLGSEHDGAFAEEVVIHERFLFHLPDDIPFDQGAILADAVSTPYHAIKYEGRIKEGDTVVIIGCGGLGIHGVGIAKALGAGRIIAVDLDEGALQNASLYGATDLINAKKIKNIGKTLKEITNGVDLLCDFSGYYKNISDSVRAMNTGGRIVLVGIGMNALKIGFPLMMIDRMISVIGSIGCDTRSIPELISLIQFKKLDLTKSITSTHKLEEVNDCLENLDQRKGNPIRFIIQPE